MKTPKPHTALATSIVFAVLIAAHSADARDLARHASAAGAQQAYASQYPDARRRGLVEPDDNVTVGGRVIGRDPDPFIRGEMRRHYETGWPD